MGGDRLLHCSGMKNSISILCTATIPAAVAQIAIAAEVRLEVVPFIDVVLLPVATIVQRISNIEPATTVAVFTSANAVKAMSSLDKEVSWIVYCTAGATKNLVAELMPNCTIAGTANNAEGVAEKLLHDRIKSVVYFCGDNRLDTLPGLLKVGGVTLTEVIVYETKEICRKVGQYEGILFFSPSAIKSYFSCNVPSIETIFFSIGETTAEALKQFTNGKIVTASIPDKGQLLKEAIEYLR